MFFRKNKKINQSEQPKTFFWSLIVLMLVGLFSYGYLVRGTIVNIVTRQNMERDLAAVSTKVITLEAEYIRVKSNVTLESAYNRGFVAISAQTFVEKNSSADLGLSVNRR